MLDDAHLYAMDCEAVRLWERDHAPDHEERGAEMVDEWAAFSFFLRVLGNAVEGRPPLREMGYRAWIMASRYAPAVCPHSERADLLMMRKLAIECNGHLELGSISSERAHDVFEFVLGRATTAEMIAKRVTVLAYGINTSAAVQSALPSMEVIGALWGLRAENKRSAVSAAARKILREAKQKMEMRATGRRNVITELWYAKKAITRDKYEAAQRGNANRLAKQRATEAEEDHEQMEARREVAVVRSGIPVRAEFASMPADRLKRHLARLREEADLRRLAGL